MEHLLHFRPDCPNCGESEMRAGGVTIAPGRLHHAQAICRGCGLVFSNPALRALLKPGGLLWIGTENYRNATHYLDRAISAARGRPAPFATSSEHTLVFNRHTLADALSRRGFGVLVCDAYQPSLRQKMETMRFRSPFSYLYFVMQHAANSVASTGPLMRLAARRI